MKKLLTIALTILVIYSSLAVLPSWIANHDQANVEFSIWTEEKLQLDPMDMPFHIRGRFWTQWIRETNDTPRLTLDHFEPCPMATNVIVIWGGSSLTNGVFISNCYQEHLDRSEHTVTKYVSSNLVAFLVWRGRTNINYLESIPITNVVHHWHWDKTQIYTD